LVSLGLILP
jgi:hypothetical protein